MSKLLGYNCSINYNIKKNLITTMSVSIKITDEFLIRDDILISVSGVLFQMLFVLMIVLLKINYLLDIALIFINVALLNLIPISFTDGYYIYKRLRESRVNRRFCHLLKILLWFIPLSSLAVGIVYFICFIIPTFSFHNGFSIGITLSWIFILVTCLRFIITNILKNITYKKEKNLENGK